MFDPGVLLEDIINDAEGAESGKLEMTGEGLRDVQRVYWSLSALEASPADYRRLLAGGRANYGERLRFG